MNWEHKISTIVLWGKEIKKQLEECPPPPSDLIPEPGVVDWHEGELWTILRKTYYQNNWLTPYHTYFMLTRIVEDYLDENVLRNWLSNYTAVSKDQQAMKVGITMAGNIPLAGFHDLLCVILSGHRAILKLSSKDSILLPYLLEKLYSIAPEIREQVRISEHLLKDCDAYIATGSDNSARYFEHYFGKYPHIIRRNRHSVAILNGDESKEDLQALCQDIFLYYGLGCRNVSMLLVPENYDWMPFIECSKEFDHFMRFAKYKNNFDYQYTLLLLNKQEHWKSECLLMEENPNLNAPISKLHFIYTNKAEKYLEAMNQEDIQVVVGKNHTPFGRAQYPAINDYADHIDTMQWLLGL